MTTHPHLEGLIPRLRDAAKSASRSGLPGLAVTISVIADDLAALPGGGVDEEMVKRFLNCQPLADQNESTRIWQFLADGIDPVDVARFALTAALSPTPNPHEADRNG